jgi:hypothetical protein
MKKKDWIILRLIRVATISNPQVAFNSIDIARSTLYLLRKYGQKHLFACIRELEQEESKCK